MASLPKPITTETLELTHLAFFVGSAANAWIVSEMKRAGFAAVRQSHGYLIQHLIEAPRSVGDLARLLDISQQAVSKGIAELELSGVVQNVASDDARVKRVRLSAHGKQVVLAARTLRRKLERRLLRRCGVEQFETARRVLDAALDELGGTDAVKRRRVRPPR